MEGLGGAAEFDGGATAGVDESGGGKKICMQTSKPELFHLWIL